MVVVAVVVTGGGRVVVVATSATAAVVVAGGRVAGGAERAGAVSAAGPEPHPAAGISRAAKAASVEMRRAGRLNVTGVPGARQGRR